MVRSYPVQGVGAYISHFDWKDKSIFDKIYAMEQNGIKKEKFYSEKRPNGIIARIDVAAVGGSDCDNELYDYLLIVYDYKAYRKTPFNSLEDLKMFFVRALRGHVNNTQREIMEMINSIAKTCHDIDWG